MVDLELFPLYGGEYSLDTIRCKPKMAAYKIFVVDDDESMCKIMSAWLSAAGHMVKYDTAASTALPQLAAFEPDAILVDLMMSEVDGLELISELRARDELANAAIIMVSARTNDLWFERAEDAGADGYLTKPLDQSSFVEKVGAIVAARQSAS